MGDPKEAFIRAVRLNRERIDPAAFPYSLPSLRKLETLEMHPKLTFFVGENGSGKSTLLEAIAVAAGLSPQGGSRDMMLPGDTGGTSLHENLTLIRNARRPRDSFFLRAESFFNVATYVDEVTTLSRYGGRRLHHQSHGESFLALVENRFGSDGLFLLDEPESALSPQRQLTFLAYFHQLVENGGQFIIATHSPILLAYPHSRIYRFDEDGIAACRYEDLEHVQVTRDFLASPERYLKHLLRSGDE